ncbi:phosphatidate cytidylyltransferase [Stakelama saccharophila]|uniref:Phosphatidate cytidylyltransferase n=1 Tax=Stakelama saccharophila TaxID=3075605 RepID=A0ABZ0B5G1_9SPHN|nr:phosphatidate cytidylyltransferase [Stakelama sp. W311]WNO52518.1 phosphatidate cytidylyltransferase [Stakelama sp. W311]
MPSDLPVRALVGAGLILLAALALWSGGLLFWLVLVIVALLMMGEWANLAHASENSRRLGQFALSVPLAIMAPPWLAAGPGFFALGLIGGAAFFTAIATRRAVLGAGIVYVGLPILALLWLRQRDDGLLLAFWAMALVWACDIGAYFAGRSLGGAKLAPAISPNKTWAGLFGGVVATAFFAAILFRFGLPLHLTIATPLLAVTAQMGDLFESWLKRRAGVKDSGDLLPGHGGFLDRLDGLVPVAPIAALLVLLPEVVR